MPKIPQFEGREELTREAANITVSPKAFGQEGRQLQETGRVIGEFAVRLKKIRDFNESNSALLKASREINQIKFDSENDPNSYNEQEYIKRLQELQATIPNEISDPTERAEFQARLGTTALSAEFDMKQSFRTRQVKDATNLFNETTSALSTDFIGAGNIVDESTALSQYQILLAKAVQKRVIDVSEVPEKIRDFGQSSVKGKIQSLILSDPDAALEMLDVEPYKEHGIDLDAATKLELRNSALSSKRKLIAAAKEEQTLRQNDRESQITLWVDKGMNGRPYQLTELENELAAGNISADFYDETRKEMLNPPADKASEAEQSAAFEDIYSRFTELKFQKDDKGGFVTSGNEAEVIRQLRLDAKKYKNTGKLDEGSYRAVITMTTPEFLGKNKEKIGWLQSGLKAIAGWGKKANASPASVSNASLRFINRADQAKTPADVMMAAHEETEKQKAADNPNMTKYKVGQKITRGGTTATVYGFDEDGEPLVDVDEEE